MDNTQQPGQVIVPHDAGEPKPPGDGAPQPERQPEPEPTPTPVPAAEPVAPAVVQAPVANPQPETIPVGQWQFRQEEVAPAAQTPLPDDIHWTASEFIAHEKSAGWYGLLALAGLAAAALDYLITRDLFSTVVILFAAAMFGVFAARKPKTQEYSLSRQGIQIGVKSYDFQDFKTFSVAEEGAIASIVFMPLKRFMPPLTLYVAPDMEDRVVDYLSAFLPFEQHKADAVDNLLRRIRF